MPNPTQSIPTTPRPIRATLALVSVLIAFSTLPWIWLSLGHFGAFAWGLFGFCSIVLLGGLMTLLVSMGRVSVGGALPLAIACFAGTVLVCAVFGIHLGARALVGDDPTLQPWVNRTLLLWILGIGALGVLATLDVYRRDARSWGLMLRSAIALVPVLGVLVWINRSGMPSVADASGELSPVRMIVFLVAGLVLGILISIGGHFLIRSFEIVASDPGSENSDHPVS